VSSNSNGIVNGSWCDADDAYRAHHDPEWGFPVRYARKLFERICLECLQSGLSSLVILRKRDNSRRACELIEEKESLRDHLWSTRSSTSTAGIRSRDRLNSSLPIRSPVRRA